jgi:peptidyl-prolyl cis-trans isomerase C
VNRLIALVLLLAAVAVGCRKPESSAAAPAAKPAAAAAAPAAAPVPEKPKPVPAQLPEVIARINGDAISKAEFETALKGVEARAGGTIPAERRDEIYRGVLNDLVAYRLLRQEANSKAVAVSDSDIDARLGQLKQQFGTEANFQAALKQQNMTLQKLRDDARTDLMVAKLLESEVNSKVTVQPSDISTFYEKNPDKFKQPEGVRASHILVMAPPTADAATKAKARQRIDEALKKAQGGADFAKLAKQYSQDGSANNGGDLGFFPRGQMVPAFEQVAFSMQPGQVSNVVETQFGYHIIKLLERRPERTVPFSEVTGQIEQFLQQQQRQQKAQAFVEQLKSKGKVEVLM